MKKHYSKKVIHHMSISVDGVLTQFKRKAIKFCSHDDGTPMSPAEAKQVFLLAKHEGKRVLPMNAECVRFSFENGCPGHIRALNPLDEDFQQIDSEYKQLNSIPQWQIFK